MGDNSVTICTWPDDRPFAYSMTYDEGTVDTLANALLEYETLSGKEVDALLRGESIIRPEDQDTPEGGHKASVPSSGKSKKPKGSPGIGPEPQPES